MQWRFVAETRDGPQPSKERAEGEFSLVESPEYYCSAVWDRLVRASLVAEKQMRFPLQGKIGGEDYFFSALTYTHSRKAYFINRAFYHWDRTHESTSTRKVTVDEIKECAEIMKETCEYLQRLADRSAGKERKQAFADIIFRDKMYVKGKPLNCMEPPNWRLFRSVFPELNREFLPRFLRLRTKASFLQLLYAWRLGWLAKALVWVKGRLRQLKLAQSS